jgi:uncharacterized protein YcfL
MKKLKVLLLVAFLGVFAMSCGGAEEKELEALNKELMTGHDEVMPKSMKIANVKKNLLAAVETESDSVKNVALEISTKLQKAEDDMYLWMDNFGKAMNEEKNLQEKLRLYKELNVEIKSIKENTDSSIEAAKEMTEKFKK